MTWFDKSASPARRWLDRAARRHEWQGLKIPEHDRSFCFLSGGIIRLGVAAVRPRCVDEQFVWAIWCGLVFEAGRLGVLLLEDNCVGRRPPSRQVDAPKRVRERPCFDWPRSRNNCFAIASRSLVFVFRG